MLNYVEGNLFDLLNADHHVMIAHVCNNKGAWGVGFVVPLAAKYPITRQEYLNWYNASYTNIPVQDMDKEVVYEEKTMMLGTIQVIRVDPLVSVCNMVAQTLGCKRPLYYNHLCTCMDELVNIMQRKYKPSLSHIICPQFGAGLAGGDWNIIEQLIIDCWVRCDINVTVVKYKP